MANYIVSYDLNGSHPTHSDMDKHMASVGYARGRILETVWYVGSSANLSEVYNHINSILSTNDRLIVVEAVESQWRNLLVNSDELISAWSNNH